MCRIDAWAVSEPLLCTMLLRAFGPKQEKGWRNAVAKMERKSFDKPEETRSINRGKIQVAKSALKASHPQRCQWSAGERGYR